MTHHSIPQLREPSSSPVRATLAGKGHPLAGLPASDQSNPCEPSSPCEAADRPALSPIGAGHPSDERIEGALESAFISVHGHSMEAVLRRDCAGVKRRARRVAA